MPVLGAVVEELTTVSGWWEERRERIARKPAVTMKSPAMMALGGRMMWSVVLKLPHQAPNQLCSCDEEGGLASAVVRTSLSW